MSYSVRKTMGLIVVLSMLIGILAACGGEAATTAPATGGDTATTAPAPGGDTATAAPGTGTTPAGGMALPANCTNVELQYWNPFTGPDGPFMGNIVDKFNSENANIKVTMTSQGEYATQLNTAAASDTLPDVAVINEDQVATSAFRNIIRPIDDLVAQSGLSGADFPAVAWNAGEVSGKRYAIPLSFVAMTMFYNEDLLTAAGITAPPTNATEFDAAAAAMTKDGNNGFMLTTGFPVQQIFQQLLHQYGGTEFSDDGTKATWNSEAGVQALQWMLDAQSKYGQANLEVDAELNAFKS
ncbi:MAG: extracellular solute-binding protein, partial [Herpetosiphonaceae bacterium]|nr:extracellular solute-binding protein [Herpetosiphonaceae bacterium]